MSFWEILFNVVAVLWSPAAIAIYGIVIGVVLFSALMSDDWLDGAEIAILVVSWLVVSVLVWAFVIWVIANGVNPLGWHYPVEAPAPAR